MSYKRNTKKVINCSILKRCFYSYSSFEHICVGFIICNFLIRKIFNILSVNIQLQNYILHFSVRVSFELLIVYRNEMDRIKKNESVFFMNKLPAGI